MVVISVSHLIPVMTLSGFPAMVPFKHVHCHLQPLSSDDRQEAPGSCSSSQAALKLGVVTSGFDTESGMLSGFGVTKWLQERETC